MAMMKMMVAVALLLVIAVASVQAVHVRKLSTPKKLSQEPHYKANIKMPKELIEVAVEGEVGWCAQSDENKAWCIQMQKMNEACHDDGADRDLCVTLYNQAKADFTAWCLEEEHVEKCALLKNAFEGPVFRPPNVSGKSGSDLKRQSRKHAA